MISHYSSHQFLLHKQAFLVYVLWGVDPFFLLCQTYRHRFTLIFPYYIFNLQYCFYFHFWKFCVVFLFFMVSLQGLSIPFIWKEPAFDFIDIPFYYSPTSLICALNLYYFLPFAILVFKFLFLWFFKVEAMIIIGLIFKFSSFRNLMLPILIWWYLFSFEH